MKFSEFTGYRLQWRRPQPTLQHTLQTSVDQCGALRTRDRAESGSEAAGGRQLRQEVPSETRIHNDH